MRLQLSVQTKDTRNPAITTPPVTPSTPKDTDPGILHYTNSLEYHHHPDSSSPIQFGHGVWSAVYKASSLPTPPQTQPPNHLTPPSSPATRTRIVAVKSPIRRDAHPVLDSEAQILTRLTRSPGAETHIIPFLGYIASSHALVMEAVPLALSTYIQEQAARRPRETRTMFEPVLGVQRWISLARDLVAGLAWMHDTAGVVHGDIKPHNILLKRAPGDGGEGEGDGYEPLYADFSSAHDLSSTSSVAGASITALTPPFAAPELLSPASLKSPTGTPPTTASDVFSLAVTLLAAATGDLLLYPGTSHMQRLAMAREGHRVVEFARSGENGGRVPGGGVVEGVVKGAVCKEPGKRVRAREWVDLVENIE